MKLIIHFHILYIKKCVTYACKKTQKPAMWCFKTKTILKSKSKYFVLYQEHLFKNQNKHVLVNQKLSNIKIFESSII